MDYWDDNFIVNITFNPMVPSISSWNELQLKSHMLEKDVIKPLSNMPLIDNEKVKNSVILYYFSHHVASQIHNK